MASPAATPPGGEKQATVSPQERFFRYFQHEITALQHQMEKLPDKPAGAERDDAIEHCLAGVARLQHEVKDASSYVPAYDQRTYAEAIKALAEKLQGIRATLVPRAKFTFKTRKNASAISLTDAAELAAQQRLKLENYDSSNATSLVSSIVPTPAFSPAKTGALSPTDEKSEPDFSSTGKDGYASKTSTRHPSFSNATSVTISNHSRLHIILPSSASHATSSGTLSSLRKCVVDMSQPTMAESGGAFASLTLKNIKDSLIVCGQVSGPIHITAVERSTLVVSCRQIRMHDCKDVDVYLHCLSRPIIEDCVGIRFAPLPDHYISTSTRDAVNMWDQVDDFKWLKKGQNPHWRVLEGDQRVKEEVWKDVVPGGPNIGPEKIREAVLPSAGRAI